MFFSATTTKNNYRDKYFVFVSEVHISPLFAYNHAKFERVEVLLKGQAHCFYFKILFYTTISMIWGEVGPKNHDLKTGGAFKEQSLYLSLTVVVQLLHYKIADTEEVTKSASTS